MFGRGVDVGRYLGGHLEGNLLGGEIEILQAARGREFTYWEESCNRSAAFPRCRAGCRTGTFRIAENWNGVRGVPWGWLEWATYS